MAQDILTKGGKPEPNDRGFAGKKLLEGEGPISLKLIEAKTGGRAAFSVAMGGQTQTVSLSVGEEFRVEQLGEKFGISVQGRSARDDASFRLLEAGFRCVGSIPGEILRREVLRELMRESGRSPIVFSSKKERTSVLIHVGSDCAIETTIREDVEYDIRRAVLLAYPGEESSDIRPAEKEGEARRRHGMFKLSRQEYVTVGKIEIYILPLMPDTKDK